jgi:hypothetical protein
MKFTVLLAFALLAVVPTHADEFIGFSSEDVQAMIGQVKANEHLQRLRELGHAPSRLPSLGKALGFTKTLTSRQDCIFNAVEARLGIAQVLPGTEFPDVLFAGDVDPDRYRAAVKAQYPASNPAGVVSIYLPDYDVIYIADSAGAYAKGGSIDEALAGQYARFLDWTQRGVRDAAVMDADAAAVMAWYRAQYPAGSSSCQR